MVKQAWNFGGGLRTGAGLVADLGPTAGGIATLSVPALVGYLGYLTQKSRNNITKDKEFEKQKRELRMFSDATRSVRK